MVVNVIGYGYDIYDGRCRAVEVGPAWAGTDAGGEANGLSRPAASAYNRPDAGTPIVLIFTMKAIDFARLRRLGPVIPGSILPTQISPGYDYVWSPYDGANQYNCQPGSTGSRLLVEGFKAAIPLPTPGQWNSRN